MADFETYRDRYTTLGFERDASGVLTVTLRGEGEGEGGGEFVLNATAHSELGAALGRHACLVPPQPRPWIVRR